MHKNKSSVGIFNNYQLWRKSLLCIVLQRHAKGTQLLPYPSDDDSECFFIIVGNVYEH